MRYLTLQEVLEAYSRERVILSVHGHTHHCIDCTTAGTRIVSNQRGYLGVQPVERFDPTCTA
jgi:calcineurin-like phosphoesterase family protein